MSIGRILFKDNPWPEGHPISSFKLKAKVVNEYVWFNIDLETENYYAERDIEDDDAVEYARDWDAPAVWGNFHRCSISTSESIGFKVCPLAEYNAGFLDGLKLEVDSDIDFQEHDWGDFTFHIYLLGHDAVTKHKIAFKRIKDSELFRMEWSGKIALAYIGEREFKYDFRVDISDIPFPEIPLTTQ